MVVIVGLIVLVIAVIVALVGVLGNAGPAHPLTENFAVFGYHVTGSTGTLFLFGIVVGAVALLGLSVLLAGAQRTAYRGRDARRQLAQSEREVALVNRDRDTLLEHHQPIDASPSHMAQAGATTSEAAGVPLRSSVLGRWRDKRRVGTARVE
jgi:hypothetical protein